MKTNIDDLLKEYNEAFQENLLASKMEVEAKSKKQKAHYRLIRASEELRDKTRELLEETLVIN